jgi:uncharacterized protein (TIGR02246 family)
MCGYCRPAVAVSNPEQMNAAFAAAVNERDLAAVLDLYEPEALLVPQPGERAVGRDEIEAALSALLALGGRMESRNRYCLQVGDVALLQGEWRFSSSEGVRMAGVSAEIVRRQPDGSWRYVVDHPFGSDD